MTISRPMSGVAIVVLVLATGCGPGGAGGGSDRPVTAQQEAWMTSLCTSLGAVVDVAGVPRTAERADAGDVPRILADRVRAVERAVAGLDGGLDRLGPPPVEDGSSVLDDLRDAVEKRRASLEKSAMFVEESDRTGVIGDVQSARAAQSAYTAGPILINDVSRVPELADAFAATPACRDVDPGVTGR